MDPLAEPSPRLVADEHSIKRLYYEQVKRRLATEPSPAQQVEEAALRLVFPESDQERRRRDSAVQLAGV